MKLWGHEVLARDLDDVTFSCLPDCGWCCTHPPEVSTGEERQVRERVPNVRTLFDGERTYLRLQGGCGACQFLDAKRQCGVYDIRPGHCRWFPFHVYFGRRVEVVLNRSCPGTRDEPGEHLRDAARHALATADAADVHRALRESHDAHRHFEEHARDAGAWGDVDAAIAELLDRGPGLLTREALADLAGGLTASDLLQRTLSTWSARDPTARPYHVTPDLRWLVLQARGARVGVHELHAAGRLKLVEAIDLGGWEDPSPELADALFPHVEALLRRESFAGSIFDTVVEQGYDLTVAEAAELEAADVAAELVVRARVVQRVTPQKDLAATAAEARRAYDADFLDRPTLGAWL